MIGHGTGLITTIRLVYKNYGGIRGALRSSYFYLSLATSVACWRFTTSDEWAEKALDILPTLAGFTIAAYAVIFSVLDEKSRKTLGSPEPLLGGRSPLLMLISSISHGIIVQVMAIISALIFLSKPFPTPIGCEKFALTVNISTGFAGLFLLNYGIFLIIASIMSIYRLLEIRSRV